MFSIYEGSLHTINFFPHLFFSHEMAEWEQFYASYKKTKKKQKS